MIRQYPEALKFLYDNLPMFQRVGAAAYKKDLTNTRRLCELLGNPQDKFRTIHIAGTNGKGSSSHMLASVLSEAGHKTGLYTSPHLKEFTERIRINGKDISRQFVVGFVDRIEAAIHEIKPSFFEITVAMAFDYFANQKVDIAVIETGLGGRLDSTNVIDPMVALITNIGMDHSDLLGDTLTMIASEKAGIIKRSKPVVIGEFQSEVADVFIARANEQSSELHFASHEFSISRAGEALNISRNGELVFNELFLPLKGHYQAKNLLGVLKTLDLLAREMQITEAHIRRGLERVIDNTRLKGRWQKLSEKPMMICDTAHNPDGMREVLQQIRSMQFDHLHVVIGMVKDKDVSEILSMMPKQASYYFCRASIPRAMDPNVLREKALAFGLHGEVIPDVNEAKRCALNNAAANDFVFIGGSTFVVAELDEL